MQYCFLFHHNPKTRTFTPAEFAGFLMGIFMRYLILFLFFFASSFAFSGEPPNPDGCVNVQFNGAHRSDWLDENRQSCGGSQYINLIKEWQDSGNFYIRCMSCSNPCFEGQTYNAATKSCSCPEGSSLQGGTSSMSCRPDSPGGEPSECSGEGEVKNIETGSCEPKTDCTYPLLYDFYSNSCMPNPNNCAIGAKPNPLNPGTCMATEPTSCPAGWALSADALNCSPSAASSAGANSSTPSNTSSAATTSTPSNTSSAATASSASNTSGTNTSSGGGGGSGGGSGGGTGGDTDGGSNSSSGSNNSWTPHSGYGNWIPISANSPCPNKYQDANGQWWCSAANTGTASSAAGQCDPTSKDYLACISQTAGTASSSGANSSACNPASADYQQCQASQQSGDKLNQVGAKYKEETDKELDKYKKAVDQDLQDFGRDGVPFKDSLNFIRSAFSRLLPVSSSCNPPIWKLFGQSYELPCFLFDVVKQAFGWALSILCAFNIWQLAVRPVDR